MNKIQKNVGKFWRKIFKKILEIENNLQMF